MIPQDIITTILEVSRLFVRRNDNILIIVNASYHEREVIYDWAFENVVLYRERTCHWAGNYFFNHLVAPDVFKTINIELEMYRPIDDVLELIDSFPIREHVSIIPKGNTEILDIIRGTNYQLLIGSTSKREIVAFTNEVSEEDRALIKMMS